MQKKYQKNNLLCYTFLKVIYMMKLASLIWTARRKEVFLSSVTLKREELDVFNEMIKGIPYEEIAELHGCSVKKINSIAKVVKAKYRVAQLENPDILEPLPE